VRSTPFLAFAGYVGLLLVAGVALVGYRVTQNLRKNG
jgi:hypothetical protein